MNFIESKLSAEKWLKEEVGIFPTDQKVKNLIDKKFNDNSLNANVIEMGAGYTIINVDDFDNKKFLELFPSIKDTLSKELGISPTNDLVSLGDIEGSSYQKYRFEFVIKNNG